MLATGKAHRFFVPQMLNLSQQWKKTNKPLPQGKGPTREKALVNLLIKLRVCEKEFQEQAGMICERNPSVSYEDTESKFYCGIGDCMAVVGYFIGENIIRDVYEKYWNQTLI
ncbi:hypothetical protein EZS27_023063 [termite gut metagenome]|uniref:Uncharacterized protein n=1 Tax=termite gut metagenome TaxID=433724 RepID=A0A5J4R348_9ZZZZ